MESGGVTLIQNGRKAQPITEGIHLYLNKPSQGRVLYQPNIPISFASDLMYEDYIEKNLGMLSVLFLLLLLGGFACIKLF